MTRTKLAAAAFRRFGVHLEAEEVTVATTKKTTAKRAAERKSTRAQKARSSKASSDGMTALELLEQDHREVETYFDDYAELNDDNEKGELSEKICLALKVHTQIEEEIFYPQARKATKDDDLLDQAIVEHASAKELISQIESMEVGEELYDAKVKVLGEQVKHHIKEEEAELFPEVEAAKMDLERLGKTIAERKAELMTELSEKQPSGRSGARQGKASVDRAAAGDKPSSAAKSRAGDEEEEEE
jgi:hemerythrin superfamily protein